MASIVKLKNKISIFLSVVLLLTIYFTNISFCDGIPFFSYVDPELVTGFVEYDKDSFPYDKNILEKSDRYAKAVENYQFVFPKATTSVILVPTTKNETGGPKFRTVLRNQKKLIDDIYEHIDPKINKINIFDTLAGHIDENVYFRYDHHWTAKGAYYAYVEFCKSNNITPVRLDELEKVLLNSTWQGSTFNSTKDERIRYATDELYCYLPRKKHNMTYMDSTDNETYHNDSCIYTEWIAYTAFLGGDNPYTVIEVDDNPKDKCILVIKDSYGNALVPFLCEHYGSIVVVDPRFASEGFVNTLKHTTKVTDVLICSALYQVEVGKYVGQMENIIKGDVKKQKLLNESGTYYKKALIEDKEKSKLKDSTRSTKSNTNK